MTLEQVFVESIKMDDAKRWTQWLEDGAERHEFDSLPRTAAGSSLYYCPKCWTVFTSVSHFSVNAPFEPTKPVNYETTHYEATLRSQGMSLEELEESQRARRLFLQLMELDYQALLSAVDEKYGTQKAKAWYRQDEKECQELTEQLKPIKDRTKGMVDGPDGPQ